MLSQRRMFVMLMSSPGQIPLDSRIHQPTLVLPFYSCVLFFLYFCLPSAELNKKSEKETLQCFIWSKRVRLRVRVLGFDSRVSIWIVYLPVLCPICLCVEFSHSEPSFAKLVEAMGQNCKTNKSVNPLTAMSEIHHTMGVETHSIFLTKFFFFSCSFHI